MEINHKNYNFLEICIKIALTLWFNLNHIYGLLLTHVRHFVFQILRLRHEKGRSFPFYSAGYLRKFSFSIWDSDFFCPDIVSSDTWDLGGEKLSTLVRHCLMTDRYLQPCAGETKARRLLAALRSNPKQQSSEIQSVGEELCRLFQQTTQVNKRTSCTPTCTRTAECAKASFKASNTLDTGTIPGSCPHVVTIRCSKSCRQQTNKQTNKQTKVLLPAWRVRIFGVSDLVDLWVIKVKKKPWSFAHVVRREIPWPKSGNVMTSNIYKYIFWNYRCLLIVRNK